MNRMVEAGIFDVYNLNKDQLNILIKCNAFGSGEHETTQSCLRIISSLDCNDKSILDIGSGTGILAFAALKKKAKYAVCFDVSFEAVKNLNENANLNCLSNIYSICSEIEAIKSQFDIIFGNIYSSIILSNIKNIDNALNKNGIFIASGINYEYNFDVRSAFEKLNYKVLELEFLEDYVTIVVKK